MLAWPVYICHCLSLICMPSAVRTGGGACYSFLLWIVNKEESWTVGAALGFRLNLHQSPWCGPVRQGRVLCRAEEVSGSGGFAPYGKVCMTPEVAGSCSVWRCVVLVGLQLVIPLALLTPCLVPLARTLQTACFLVRGVEIVLFPSQQ